jgi:hypothetical protein
MWGGKSAAEAAWAFELAALSPHPKATAEQSEAAATPLSIVEQR